MPASARACTGRAACTSAAAVTAPRRACPRRPHHRAPAHTPTTRPLERPPRAFADVEPSPPLEPLATPRPASPDASLIAPDAVLHTDAGVPVYVFGTEHAAADPAVGAAILGCAPGAVVVETALSPGHGAARGVAISGVGDWPSADAPAATVATAAANPGAEAVVEQARGLAAQLAARLPATPSSLPSPPSPAGPAAMDWDATPPGAAALWQALAGHFAGEQLAYVAALASGARLVHGDRPKHLTLARLARGGSLAELDTAVAAANAANYASIVEGGTDAPAPPPPEEQGRSAFRALLLERDACLCATIAAEAAASAAAAAAAGGPGAHARPIVAVVGAWHVPGLVHLWEGGRWKAMVEEAEADPPTEEAWAAAEAAKTGGRLSPGAALGVGRALVDALLRFTATADGGVGEVDPSAVAVPGGVEGEAAAAVTAELWGSTRMLLALLPPELLPRVASGWRKELDEVLAPLRAARPVNGGAGADEAALTIVRGLNFLLWK
jgi:hypothetical protein